MARLNPSEKQALLDFARQPPPPAIPFADYLRAISKLPPSLRPEKPVRFHREPLETLTSQVGSPTPADFLPP